MKRLILSLLLLLLVIVGLLITNVSANTQNTAQQETDTPTVTGTQGTFTPTATMTGTPGIPDVRIIDVRFYPPGDDPDLEYVLLQNRGQAAQNLVGWSLRNKQGQIFQLVGGYLGTTRDVRVWTGQGVNGVDLYLGLTASIWNNTGDCAYLYDTAGILISAYCYPAAASVYIPVIRK